MYMGSLLIGMSVHHNSALPHRLEKGVRVSPRTGVTVGSLVMGTGNCTQVIWKNTSVLTC